MTVFGLVAANETLAEARTRNIREAMAEDIGTGDWTARMIPVRPLVARVRVREAAVLCGREWFEGCIRTLDRSARIGWVYEEGQDMPPNVTICEITAASRALLSGERPALNFLQMLSGTATITRRFVRAIQGVSPNPNGCRILDTRKTVPGLRLAQKYAVRMGGGANQRLGLWDGILIKENHIAAEGGVRAAIQAARELNAGVGIQVEVETLEQLADAIDAGVENILLDNFTLPKLRDAVALAGGRAILEASGGVTIESVREIAATGVDRISVGALTKDVRAIDFSMRMV